MKIKELIRTVKHRPWNLPKGDWSFYQEWNNAVFLHWQVDLTELKKFVPEQLEIDLFDGKPWVSMIAFTMEKIRPRYLPAFPPISNFDEINIRTYVKRNGKTGVHFLSIEGGSKLSCEIAKAVSELPYYFSEMNRTKNTFDSSNPVTGDELHLKYMLGNNVKAKEPIDLWLTERYALFQNTQKFINSFEIHHIEWPIQDLSIENLDVNYPKFKNLISNTPHKTHYSKGVEIISWSKEKSPIQ